MFCLQAREPYGALVKKNKDHRNEHYSGTPRQSMYKRYTSLKQWFETMSSLMYLLLSQMKWPVILTETSPVTTTAASHWDGGVTATTTAGTTLMNAAAVSAVLCIKLHYSVAFEGSDESVYSEKLGALLWCHLSVI